VLAASDAAFRIAKRERRSGNLPEVLVWHELRKRPGGFKFRRQHPIGDLVLDFVCLERRVAIEIDGFAHVQRPAATRRAPRCSPPRARVCRAANSGCHCPEIHR